MRFDATEIGGWQEICAYGTVVKIRPLSWSVSMARASVPDRTTGCCRAGCHRS
jgi:hypothetical protein